MQRAVGRKGGCPFRWGSQWAPVEVILCLWDRRETKSGQCSGGRTSALLGCVVWALVSCCA